ncbi:MAG: peptide deformylase, partial [Rhodospirillales bacterium]|nr:peptide deformylase [Rhodospirillales bacterium]
ADSLRSGLTRDQAMLMQSSTGHPQYEQPYGPTVPAYYALIAQAHMGRFGTLPEHFADVVRPERVRVRYLDRDNEIREIVAEDLLATCIQHEIDHLDGVLFVDHVSALKRNMILRKLQKAKKLAHTNA